MSLPADLLTRRSTHFVLWRPNQSTVPPLLICGKFTPGNPPTLIGERQFPMNPAAGVNGLWEVAAAACGFSEGDIVHYWFEVDDTHPHRDSSRRVRCTDPAAHTVDWRLTEDSGRQPAAVVQFAGGQLIPCDPGGEKADFRSDVPLNRLPPNNVLVIYELPTAWTRTDGEGPKEKSDGTFRDARALIDKTVGGANFAGSPVLAPGRSYLDRIGHQCTRTTAARRQFLQT